MAELDANGSPKTTAMMNGDRQGASPEPFLAAGAEELEVDDGAEVVLCHVRFEVCRVGPVRVFRRPGRRSPPGEPSWSCKAGPRRWPNEFFEDVGASSASSAMDSLE